MTALIRMLHKPRLYRRRFFARSRRGRFYNEEPTPPWAKHIFKWLFARKREAWPKWIENASHKVTHSTSHQPRLYLVNHSTVLIQVGGMNFITDPVFSPRVGPFHWLGPRRAQAPGIAFEDLPKIDAILLSHDHYDHLDVRTVRRIVERDGAKIFCGLIVDKTLRHEGLVAEDTFDWWESRAVASGLSLHFVPMRHFSGRGFRDQDSTLWGGWVVESEYGQIFFCGDSGYGKHFREIGKRFNNIVAAFLPIGCYEPRWFMEPFHMSPDDAVKAHMDLKAKKSIGIHFGTFCLGDESIDRPAIDLQKALQERGIAPENFIVPLFGKEYLP